MLNDRILKLIYLLIILYTKIKKTESKKPFQKNYSIKPNNPSY